jgi:hypothetical protein
MCGGLRFKSEGRLLSTLILLNQKRNPARNGGALEHDLRLLNHFQ